MSKKEENGNNSIIPSTVREAIESIAKGIGVAATELWTIFVRQYIVKGISELFTALILFAAAYGLRETIGLWSLLPAAIGVAFVYGAIAFLGNPKYYAIGDITDKIREFKSESTSS